MRLKSERNEVYECCQEAEILDQESITLVRKWKKGKNNENIKNIIMNWREELSTSKDGGRYSKEREDEDDDEKEEENGTHKRIK